MQRSSPKKTILLSAKNFRFGLVVSTFNREIGLRLEKGARHFLEERGAEKSNIQTFFVPGAFEIPLLLKKLAESGKYDALVALGVVIRGETAHFDYVAGEASRGIAQVAYDFGLPVGFGLLTTENKKQALDRGDKGEEAASAALEMIHQLKKV
ncbi:MAG: 6,7-dimethyl-8-ribityllumazine synthase [Deltaproteobacteria bacterium]|nr:6,7-dimethyl-8-ribityllumazine synthase [Deltaproteobacteria bacterium]